MSSVGGSAGVGIAGRTGQATAPREGERPGQSGIDRRPRLGFLGVGWIGRHRLQSIVASGGAEVVALADPSPEAIDGASKIVPEAELAGSLTDLLALGVDGVVIATPSAQHAAEAVAALEAGVAVFCQKPLGRTETEVREVVRAAERADRLLGVDLSYRFTAGMQAVRGLVQGGELGEIYAVDLVFHNAYGPDKPWFYDMSLSGGGCLMDLGIHLIDLALWVLPDARVEGVRSRLFAGGARLHGAGIEGPGPGGWPVEDYGVAELDLGGGTVVRLASSWGLPAGSDAVIEASFYGTRGGASFRNLEGSFYDFRAEALEGTARRSLAEPPDDWGGRAAVSWVSRLGEGVGYDPEVEGLVEVARTLDRIYGR